ncbi:MAG: hypothetical protein O3B95_12900, partial [Chloroflexi bacterium]|nr:hypothetical protein [Chloroflexota bacterium]
MHLRRARCRHAMHREERLDRTIMGRTIGVRVLVRSCVIRNPSATRSAGAASLAARRAVPSRIVLPVVVLSEVRMRQIREANARDTTRWPGARRECLHRTIADRAMDEGEMTLAIMATGYLGRIVLPVGCLS